MVRTRRVDRSGIGGGDNCGIDWRVDALIGGAADDFRHTASRSPQKCDRNFIQSVARGRSFRPIGDKVFDHSRVCQCRSISQIGQVVFADLSQDPTHDLA